MENPLEIIRWSLAYTAHNKKITLEEWEKATDYLLKLEESNEA